LLDEANVGTNPQYHSYAIIKYTVGKERPVREFGQRCPITPGSAQEAFFTGNPHYYAVVCKFATEPQQKTWQIYDERSRHLLPSEIFLRTFDQLSHAAALQLC
jgi:hypothetical protein